MNNKKAKKLRRLAMEISSSIAKGANAHILDANPFKVYKELKKIDKDTKKNK